MVYYKYCHAASEHWYADPMTSGQFEAPLRSWIRWCPEHKNRGLLRDVQYIKIYRMIPVEWFDVYAENENGELRRVCRACGGELLTKKGKPHPALRWCKRDDQEHVKLVNQTLCTFSGARDRFLIDLAIEQAPALISTRGITLNKKDSEYINYPGYFATLQGHRVIACQRCGNLISLHDYYNIKSGYVSLGAHVHHKIPVASLTFENINLVFDSSNFIALCINCHHDQHSREARLRKDFLTLDQFAGEAK